MRQPPEIRMKPARTIDKIEVSDLFWKDLGLWRGHGDYFAIRKSIAEMVLLASSGTLAGDKAFTGGRAVWSGIRHKHLPAKLICFTMYPHDHTMRLCAVKKHDFYGVRNERRSRVDDAAHKIRGAAERPAARSPHWAGLRWEHPAELVVHPELPELSADALTRLHADIIAEQDGLVRLERRIEAMGLSGERELEFMDAWMSGLCDAQVRVEESLIALATRLPDYLEPEAFEPWLAGPE